MALDGEFDPPPSPQTRAPPWRPSTARRWTTSAIALGRRAAWVRWSGAVGAFLLALICVLWVAFVVGQYVSLAFGGTAVGDSQDLISETYWVPVTVVVGALNGLALRRAFSGATIGPDRAPAARSR